MLFEHEANRLSVQHHPRDPASVKAMKQTCVIAILAVFILPYSSTICTENAAKTFSYSGFLKTKWCWLCTFKRYNDISVCNVFTNKNIGEMISLVRSAFCI